MRRLARGEKLDEDEEEDDDDENDLGAQILRNLKARDPRGAAQESMVRPANLLLMTALLGFFGWVGYFIAFMIPIAFPNKEDEGAKAAAQAGNAKGTVTQQTLDKVRDKGGMPWSVADKLKPLIGKTYPTHDAFIKDVRKIFPDREDADAIAKATRDDFPKADIYTHWWSAETILDEDNTPWSVLLFLFVLLLGVAQAGVMAVASTKIQSLESFKWGVTGMIVALIPLTSFPLFVLMTNIIDLLDSGIELGLTDPVSKQCWTWTIALVAFIVGPIVGAIGLAALYRPHVRPGFEFKPD
jgi:hypothetical protein